MLLEGDAVPKKKKTTTTPTGMVQFNSSIPQVLKKDIQKLAIDKSMGVSELVTVALSYYLETQTLSLKDGTLPAPEGKNDVS